jgi:hypothetical protein
MTMTTTTTASDLGNKNANNKMQISSEVVDLSSMEAGSGIKGKWGGDLGNTKDKSDAGDDVEVYVSADADHAVPESSLDPSRGKRSDNKTRLSASVRDDPFSERESKCLKWSNISMVLVSYLRRVVELNRVIS